jgi:hypothetical protein
MAKEIGLICEQGDMGLFYDPLNESDRKLYEQQRKQKEKGHKSNSASNESGKR